MCSIYSTVICICSMYVHRLCFCTYIHTRTTRSPFQLSAVSRADGFGLIGGIPHRHLRKKLCFLPHVLYLLTLSGNYVLSAYVYDIQTQTPKTCNAILYYYTYTIAYVYVHENGCLTEYCHIVSGDCCH